MFVRSSHRKHPLPASSHVCSSLTLQNIYVFSVLRTLEIVELNIRELVAMTPEEKEAKGVVIQEISMSKLALAGF